MRRIKYIRILIWSLCLELTRCCNRNEFQDIEWIEMSYTGCYNTPMALTLYKDVDLYNGREKFSGIEPEHPYIKRVLFYSGIWNFASGPEMTFVGPQSAESSTTVPVVNWYASCNGQSYNPNVNMVRSNCYRCRNNKITVPPSNICVCAEGQSLNRFHYCADCWNNKYKDSPGDHECSLCGDGRISSKGSTSFDDCLCLAGSVHTGPGPCSSCQNGKFKPEISNGNCTNCTENSYSAQGSSASTDCVCNAGYVGENGGPCILCEAGKYAMTT